MGNVFTTIGVVVSDFNFAWGIGSISDDNVIIPAVFASVNMLFCIIFCILIGIVYKSRVQYKIQNGQFKAYKKKKSAAIILALLFGWCGGHKYYLCRKTQGALCSVFFYTGIPIIVAIVDIIRIAVMSSAEFDDNYNESFNYTQIQNRENIYSPSDTPKLYADSSYTTKVETKESFASNQDSKIEIKDLDLMIGTVSVIGDNSDDVKIYITGTTGKKYEFNAKGNMIYSSKVAGKPEYIYGEV